MARHHLACNAITDGLELPLTLNPLEVTQMQASGVVQGIDAVVDRGQQG